MSQPFMQLYVADYLGDTRHLTTEQHGAYLLLLMTMWRADGVLPNCDKKLARIVGATASRWAKIKADVLAFFDADEDGITNKRLMFELKKASEKSIKRAEVGTKGGEAKALKSKGTDLAIASRLPPHTRASSESEPEPDNISSPKGECQPKADPLPVKAAFDLWNEQAARLRLPLAKDLTETRRKQIKARLSQAGLDGWREALDAVAASPMCRGENERGWRADLDFVCQPKSFAKLREGSYASTGKGSTNSAAPAAPSAMSPELQARRRAMLEADHV